ncbi:MAG: oligosaccharide flippase family protein [Bacteroidia bacterium]|nr:oligosaccharide flippase family protein [Bacteroidia bacterium]
MSSIKKLAGQTFWYGLSSIFGRFLNYLLTPILATIFASEDYGKITTLFTIAAFLNIVYTYGLETSYFRFSSQQPESKVYNTCSSSILITTFLLTGFLLLTAGGIASFLELPQHPEYITWVILIVALDTLAVMPFAKLRYTGRPIRFAAIKILNILINVGLVLFFLVLCKNAHEKDQANLWSTLYNPNIGLGYVIIANLAASGITILLLYKELISFRFKLNPGFWRELMAYSWPLIIVGFGGMINETIDRIMLLKLYPGTTDEAFSQTGIYGANYKLSVVIVLFIQAFRMGAEPFFFKQSTDANAPRTYARVMKFFIITCCFCFLLVVLFLDLWKYFMGTRHPEYYTGLKVVPILMTAKIFLGAYYNLSIWYKLTNRNLTGAWITLGGSAITILFNWFFIPKWGYTACAIATILCYGFMMVSSYLLGQKYYPIPYAWKKLLAYIAICILLFGIHQAFLLLNLNVWVNRSAGLVLIGLFTVFYIKCGEKRISGYPLYWQASQIMTDQYNFTKGLFIFSKPMVVTGP